MFRVLILLLSLSTPAFAQNVQSSPSAPVLSPPRVVRLEPIERGADERDSPTSATARIEVDVHGHASVISCDPGALCSRVTEVIERAEFEPAQRDGEAISARVQVRLEVRAEPDEPDDETPLAVGIGCQTMIGAGTTWDGTQAEFDRRSTCAPVANPPIALPNLSLRATF